MAIKPLDYMRAMRDERELSVSEQIVALYIMSPAGPDGRRSHTGNVLLERLS